jgi:predicted ATP-grasp superfamily ATP-dependent carboligase
MKRLLVTGAGGSAAFNFVDALRLAHEADPMYIVGADVKPHHLPLTRTDRNYLVPRADAKDYVDQINRIIDREKIDFLHAQPDVEVDVLSRRRDELAAKTFLPPDATIVLCGDKMRFNRTMSQAGLPVPEAYFLNKEEDLEPALRAIFSQHEKAWLRAIRGAGARASLPVKKVEHARAWVDYWTTMRGVGWGDFMVSEFLPGKEFAFQSLWHQGNLVVSQARERVEYIFGHLTPSGQSSSPSVARTVHRDDVNDLATRAILAADPAPHGIFCVDLKENAAGQPRVTEINCGRFFTTSNFYAHCGVNFPQAYVRLGLGEAVPTFARYNPVPADWWWVRMIDMGYGLVKGSDPKSDWKVERV